MSSSSNMEVDPPSKESSMDVTQQDSQKGAIPARVQPAEELLSIQLVPGEPDRISRIGSQLSPTLTGQLTVFLEQNVDVFAWTANFVRINPSIAVHSLNIDPDFPPVKQKKRHCGPEKDKII
ncbi:UNVERIFIED_CONTAM: hypothetical protein Sindi_0961100 [Sesamum indicum]